MTSANAVLKVLKQGIRIFLGGAGVVLERRKREELDRVPIERRSSERYG